MGCEDADDDDVKSRINALKAELVAIIIKQETVVEAAETKDG